MWTSRRNATGQLWLSIAPPRCFVASPAWSRTQTATFHDVRASVRPQGWTHGTCCTAPTDPAVAFVPCSTSERLAQAVCSCVGNVQIAMSRRDTTTDAMSISEKVKLRTCLKRSQTASQMRETRDRKTNTQISPTDLTDARWNCIKELAHGYFW
jgi:hypothetical protein